MKRYKMWAAVHLYRDKVLVYIYDAWGLWWARKRLYAEWESVGKFLEFASGKSNEQIMQDLGLNPAETRIDLYDHDPII